MTHCTRRSRERAGHQTVTGPVTPTCLHDRWGRVEATRTALGEALVMRRRTRVRFPPPPPLCESPGRVTDRGSRALRSPSGVGIALFAGGCEGASGGQTHEVGVEVDVLHGPLRAGGGAAEPVLIAAPV